MFFPVNDDGEGYRFGRQSDDGDGAVGLVHVGFLRFDDLFCLRGDRLLSLPLDDADDEACGDDQARHRHEESAGNGGKRYMPFLVIFNFYLLRFLKLQELSCREKVAVTVRAAIGNNIRRDIVAGSSQKTLPALRT